MSSIRVGRGGSGDGGWATTTGDGESAGAAAAAAATRALLQDSSGPGRNFVCGRCAQYIVHVF